MQTSSCSWLNQKQAEQIANDFGTPTYVYSEKKIRENAAACLAFPNAYGLTVRYAMKANPNSSILLLLQKLGIYFDASSAWEVRRAIHIGIEPTRISLSTQELPKDFASLVEQGVEINCCSLDQLERYAKAFPGSEVGIRLNPGKGSGLNNRLSTGGLAASFGIWHEFIPQINEIAQASRCKIVRIHTHVGTGGDPDVWFQTATESLKSLDAFPHVHTVDLGGGFKIARMPHEKQSDLQVVGSAVKKAIEAVQARTGRKLHLEIEPGNFIAANLGGILSEIQDETSTGKDGYSFLKLDTGMTEILRPSLYGAQHSFRVFQKILSEETASYAIVGHCCESGDVLTVANGDSETLAPRELPVCTIGDLIMIEDAGAYCAAMPAKNYNSFPEASEVMVLENGEIREVRKRQTLDQVIQNETPIKW
ncbi:MAG: diaminopimelate decarboxylase [Opitutales bacterium]|nr:diaminopimelate decarboxylase [Opitutales bacterium]